MAIPLPPPHPMSDVGPEGDLGLAHLHELIETRFLGRVKALKARTAMTALATLLRVAPPAVTTEPPPTDSGRSVPLT